MHHPQGVVFSIWRRWLAKIIVFVSGLSPGIEWIFRSHEVTFGTAEEEDIEKSQLFDAMNLTSNNKKMEKVLIFTTSVEALKFCETLLLHDINGGYQNSRFASPSRTLSNENSLEKRSNARKISTILSNFLSTNANQSDILERLMDLRYHSEVTYDAGEVVFAKRSNSDSYYIVLNGTVANSTSSAFQVAKKQQCVVSGAGTVDQMQRIGVVSSERISTLWQVGGVFGFNDFLFDRKRTFQTIATVDETKLAIFSRSGMNTLSTQDPELYALMQQVLLRASTLDLANCTCQDVHILNIEHGI